MSNEITAPAEPRKAPLGFGRAGVELASFDDLWRFAQAVAASGLAPKGLEKPEAIMIAVQFGAELGLPPMASLQNIAPINGRPSLWGDAMLGVVRGTGMLEVFNEWYEKDGVRLARNPQDFTDDVMAVCLVKRAGYEAKESSFSVGDAKTAGLWKKQGPWSQYPARMLQFRARSFALRDSFGDALRGLKAAEEEMDEPAPYRDVTPPVSAYDVPAGSLPAPVAETAPQGTRKRRTTAPKEETAAPASPAAPTASMEEAEKVVDQIASGEAAERAAIIEQIKKWLADNDPGFTLAMFAEGCKTTVEAFLGTADQSLDIPRLRNCLAKISTVHAGAKAQLAANAKAAKAAAAAEAAPKSDYEPVEGEDQENLFK